MSMIPLPPGPDAPPARRSAGTSGMVATRHPLHAAVIWTLLLLTGATMVVPFLWMISTSLKAAGSVYSLPPQWIPDPFVWRNYLETWRIQPFGRFYLNSIIVTFSITIGQVLTSSLAAYAFARLDFRFRDTLFMAYLCTMMVPAAVTMIPVFILLSQLGWIDTYRALILPLAFSAYGTFLLRQFFMGIPKDLEEAAFIDGCGHFRIYLMIVLPLSKPALATLSLFTFMGAWRDFMWPLVVTNSAEMRTLPVGLASFQGMYSTNWPLLMAASVLVMAPLVLVFLFNQRHFVESINMSGVKG